MRMDKSKNKLSWTWSVRFTIRALKTYYVVNRVHVIVYIAIMAWEALIPYVGICLSACLIDELTNARNPERLKALVLVTLISAAVIGIVAAILYKIRRIYNDHVTWDNLEHIYAKKMMDMDFGKFDDTKTAEQRSLIRQYQSMGFGISTALIIYGGVCKAVLTAIGGIGLTISLFTSRISNTSGAYAFLDNPVVVLLVIVSLVLISCISPVLLIKADKYLVRDDLRVGNNKLLFWGFLGGKSDVAMDVRMYRLDKMCVKYCFDKESGFNSKSRIAKIGWGPQGLLKAASAAVSMMFPGIVYVFVCLKALAGAFGAGAVTQYIAAIQKTAYGFSSLVEMLGYMRNNALILKQVFEFLDIPNDMYQGSLTVEKRSDRKYEIEFRNVSFKYPGSGNYALKNVNMKFEIGKRLAVVGMNGSGKTTFIKLLCRLYDPTEGEILLNGIDIRKYNYAEYMNIFSVVFQDFKLLALKLGENVASGTEYDEKRVMKCLKDAGFEDNLKKMPQGLETYLYTDYGKNGVNISGGEAQKLAIARALYKDAPFIILDEPTAALDPVTEAEIYSRFNAIVGDKTAIYISHRLSSCRFCDEIIVFNEGAVIQQGTHESLAADENGKYYELWHAQAQYYMS